MKGRVRIVGGGDVLFDRDCRIGNHEGSDLLVELEDKLPFALSISWDLKQSGWLISYEKGSVAVEVGDSKMRAGDQGRPIFSPTSLQIGGHTLVFDAIPDPPIMGKLKTGSSGKISLKGLKKVEIGRGDREVGEGVVRMQLDKEIRSISSLHTVLERKDSFWYITNCGSNDTILNGQAFDTSKLVFGDRFRIGPYLFAFFVDHLKRLDDQNPGSIQARGLKRVVEKVAEGTGKKSKIAILSNVDLDIQSGEFVAIIGGSGQGKSTLMNALCGVAPPTGGNVWINEMEISDRTAIMSAGVGFVPQDDIVHRELKVIDALLMSARLKLNLPKNEIQSLTERIMDLLDLTAHQTKQIRRLSGGQRKRVSIATEMLSSPAVLFLDEPTSGLDPATEWELMTALQKLAEAGTTVVCTTHMLENAHICNRFIIVQDGRVIFDGPPGSAREYFLNSGKDGTRSTESGTHGGAKLASFSKIFMEIKGARKSGVEWEDEFRSSRHSRSFKPVGITGRKKKSTTKERVRTVGFARVLSLLTLRQWKIVSSDKLNLIFLFAQAFLIGFLIAWVSDGVVLRAFLAIVATMWFGCSNGAQQIVGELSIFRRERISGQGINAYIFSKFGFLSLLTTIQAAILFSTIYLTVFLMQGAEAGRLFRFPEMTDGKSDKFEELLRSRLFKVPDSGADLADDISIKLLTPVLDAGSAPEGAPEAALMVAKVSGPGLVESIAVPGLLLGVDKKENWKPGGKVEFAHGEKLLLPNDLPDYPENGFPAVDVAPGMARSPFLKQGGWTVFGEREREKRWKPGATVLCSITQQTYVLPDHLPPWQTESLRYRLTYGFLRFFMLEEALLDSNTVVSSAKDSSNQKGGGQLQEGAFGELHLGGLVLSIFGLKIFALILAGTVGVSIGLMISALVQNSTQAVLWVPLILIPQILFGGFVVKIPEMTPSVRAVSFFFPSYAAQKIMDVSHIYGRIVPKISNKTKMPVFTEGDGEKVEWVQKDFVSGEEKKKSQKFQREIPESSSWQNLLITPERMGQHEIAGNFLQVFDADGAFKTSVRQEPDTVDSRRDINALYYQGIRFVRFRDAQIGMIILICWTILCYIVILASLIKKQTGQ